MPCPQYCFPIQYVTCGLLSERKLPTEPTTSPFRTIAFMVHVGSSLTRRQCFTYAPQSDGSRDTNAAIQLASGSRCCSNNTGRSLSSRSRRTISAAGSMLKIVQHGWAQEPPRSADAPAATQPGNGAAVRSVGQGYDNPTSRPL